MHHRVLLFALALWIPAACGWCQRTQPLQHMWEVDPKLAEEDIWVIPIPERTIDFDVASLKSESIEERLRVARLICREHANSRFKQRGEAAELLLQQVRIGEDPIQVRRAMLSAAVLVSDAAEAAELWKLGQADAISRKEIERALVRWRSDVAVATWRERIKDVNAPATDIGLALEGLAVTGNSTDRRQLEIVFRHSTTTLANRLLAAKALGTLVTDGLNELAQEVMSSDLTQRELFAANLLHRHAGTATLEQLNRILQQAGPTAQAVAYRALADNFPERAHAMAGEISQHNDQSLRLMALEVLHRASDDGSLRLQGALMKDRNPTVRRLATQMLFEKAAKQRELVDAIVTENLNSEVWQGIEQAISLATLLQDHSRLTKYLQLLDHPQPDVNIHAGWALMELTVEPDILAGIHVHAQKLTEILALGKEPPREHDLIRLSFLLESFGKNLYEPATSMLVRYIPKDGFKMGVVSRASAIWSLGKLNRGKDNPKLRADLEGRVADIDGPVAEDMLVRFTSMLAIGEMAYADCLDTAQKFNAPLPSIMGYCCEWAIAQIKAAQNAQPKL